MISLRPLHITALYFSSGSLLIHPNIAESSVNFVARAVMKVWNLQVELDWRQQNTTWCCNTHYQIKEHYLVLHIVGYLSGSLYSMRWYLLTFPVASLKVDLVCIQTAEHQETFSSVILVQSRLFTPEPSSLHHDVRAIAIKLWWPWLLWSFWLQLCISQKHFDCDTSIWSCNLVSCGHSRLQLPR